MPLTLDGIPLVIDPAAEEAATAMLDPFDATDAVGMTFIGPQPGDAPWFQWPQQPEGIGALTWPCWGLSRWATGHFMADAASAAELRRRVALGLAAGDGGMDLLIHAAAAYGGSIGNADPVTLRVFLLPPRPIARPDLPAPGDATTRGLYLISVVDARYFLRSKSVRPDLDLDLGCGATWADVYAALAEDAGIELEVDKPRDEYLAPPRSLAALAGRNAAVALDAVATSLGQRIVANYDGTFRAQSADRAASERLASEAVARSRGRMRLGGGDVYAETL